MKDAMAAWCNGWLDQARPIYSPNFDARPLGVEPCLIVIHAISLPPDDFGGTGVVDLFCNCLDPGAHPFYETICLLRVSAHFFIRRDGELLQFVSVDDRAWHAGLSYWKGRERCNDFSVGVELEGCDTMPFEAVQYAKLRELVALLRQRYPINDIAAHSDISPGRKTDPGPFFDWSELE